ncbi:HupE/UreJ family protein [Thiomicrorhabdus sediminis]|uniref:HupE/UreJ family protein n=1 Tax=Thiomicrorhabdus sediminis TaxID=2580412 RepID=A0A4P9K3U6_9GAMM|nr:HupE/UreJ family protein [Thiomicrorhabdus sediminis]QCU89604.1 HupE/UreJ family protein [Thiomicrorhabdus sediminis]
MLFTIRKSTWLLIAITALLLSQFFTQAYAHGMSAAEKQAIIDGGNWSYLSIGITHMLSGYDHLLFVFGIIFLLTSFKEIVKYITAFTLGHSVTLIYATFNGIQINYFFIDAIIALSIVYIAFANLDGFNKHLGVKAPNLLLMITSLGLIHGLGLSTRLQQLPLSESDLLLNIIAFNVGIEIGQILALSAMLVVMNILRKKLVFGTFNKIANYGLIFAGLFLFMMQSHGYWHTTTPDEFGFSNDNHIHHHIEMEQQRAAELINNSHRDSID